MKKIQLANMQLNAYNYFKNLSKQDGTSWCIQAEKLGACGHQPANGADQGALIEQNTASKDNDSHSVTLSQSKIDFLKQIPRSVLTQAGFGDLNLENDSDDGDFLS